MPQTRHYETFVDEASKRYLQILGGFHPKATDQCPEGTATLLMLGPMEPEFWPHFTTQREYKDGHPHPLDRWSTRVVSDLALITGSTALFPFGGPPWLPFYRWALRTGRCWNSPVTLLVHDTAGLFVSFRGALAVSKHLDLPAVNPTAPCESCNSRPCIRACPVSVLDDLHYDTKGCVNYVSSKAGENCLNQGCAVRRSCPVSVGFGRDESQSKFHQLALIGQKRSP